MTDETIAKFANPAVRSTLEWAREKARQRRNRPWYYEYLPDDDWD